MRVIGCGNPDAGDDAAGLLAVAQVRSRLAEVPGVEVVEAGPGLRVLDLLEGVTAVVVVDAVRSRFPTLIPGVIVRAEAGPAGLPAGLRSSLSSHGLGLAETIGLAAALGRVPHLVFLGIEVGEVAVGTPPSPQVLAAIPSLAHAVEEEARRLAEEVGR